MSRIDRLCLLVGLCALANGLSRPAIAESKVAVSVEDCVRTRRIFKDQIEVSPDGLWVAFVVKAPNTENNKNEYLLYLRGLEGTDKRENGRALVRSDRPLEGLQWTYWGEKPVLLYEPDTMQEVVEVDPVSGTRRNALTSVDPIASFSAEADGETLVYSTVSRKFDDAKHTAYTERGFPIIFWKGLAPPGEGYRDYPRSRVFVARREPDGQFSSTAFIHKDLESLRDISGLSLSPDGRYLVFSYKTNDIPAGWERNPLIRWFHTAAGMLGLLDLQTREFSVAFNAPAASWWLPVAWATDGSGFTLNAVSPVGSLWEKRDHEEGFTEGDQVGSYTHVFALSVRTRTVSEVLKHPALWYSNETLFWSGGDDRLLVRRDKESFAWLKQGVAGWEEIGRSRLSVGPTNITPSTEFVRMNARSDGKRIVGVLETRMTPPDLFVHDLSRERSSVLTDLNPEFRKIRLEPVENFNWLDRLGYHCTGYLIKPDHYDPRMRYPLVVMAKTWIEDYFVGDTQYRTAFAPQVLASSGFVVLMANERATEFESNRALKYPWRGPGRLREVHEFEAVIEGGIDALVKSGLVDKRNVGLVGFSTTSWKTDIVLSHPTFPFRAASSADSGLWNYGLYWISNIPGDVDEEYMGGPPYGKTLGNWLRFSPAFNAQRVHTPLLMEYIEPPTAGLEFFVALRRQGKPVDLFFYPDGEHELDKPFQRVASLQRNVDWFRFWMQGYQDKPPSYDPEQYVRWSELRRMQEAAER